MASSATRRSAARRERGRPGRAAPLGREELLRVDLRDSTIVEAEHFPEARKPAWKLRVDLGTELGVERSSVWSAARRGAQLGVERSLAQLTDLCSPDDLVGRRVLSVRDTSSSFHGDDVPHIRDRTHPGAAAPRR